MPGRAIWAGSRTQVCMIDVTDLGTADAHLVTVDLRTQKQHWPMQRCLRSSSVMLATGTTDHLVRAHTHTEVHTGVCFRSWKNQNGTEFQLSILPNLQKTAAQRQLWPENVEKRLEFEVVAVPFVGTGN